MASALKQSWHRYSKLNYRQDLLSVFLASLPPLPPFPVFLSDIISTRFKQPAADMLIQREIGAFLPRDILGAGKGVFYWG